MQQLHCVLLTPVGPARRHRRWYCPGADRRRTGPAGTAEAAAGLTAERGHPVGELRRLSTFPDGFELAGRRSSVQAQIGSSVPPLLARQVVDALVT
ncbi:MAG TPA: DNA cytosine methyltransferase [Micromonosporaceae bacterium]|nr:DNA cytosine methyltransferase [Micromonosporaceae bacterium]